MTSGQTAPGAMSACGRWAGQHQHRNLAHLPRFLLAWMSCSFLVISVNAPMKMLRFSVCLFGLVAWGLTELQAGPGHAGAAPTGRGTQAITRQAGPVGRQVPRPGSPAPVTSPLHGGAHGKALTHRLPCRHGANYPGYFFGAPGFYGVPEQAPVAQQPTLNSYQALGYQWAVNLRAGSASSEQLQAPLQDILDHGSAADRDDFKYGFALAYGTGGDALFDQAWQATLSSK